VLPLPHHPHRRHIGLLVRGRVPLLEVELAVLEFPVLELVDEPVIRRVDTRELGSVTAPASLVAARRASFVRPGLGEPWLRVGRLVPRWHALSLPPRLLQDQTDLEPVDNQQLGAVHAADATVRAGRATEVGAETSDRNRRSEPTTGTDDRNRRSEPTTGTDDPNRRPEPTTGTDGRNRRPETA
jgi:hypothetical protein